MEVLKDSSATALYGAKGKHGAVLITTKTKEEKEASTPSKEQVSGAAFTVSGQQNTPATETSAGPTEKLQDKDQAKAPNRKTTINPTAIPKDAQVYIDGVEKNQEEWKQVQANDIKSIDIQKDAVTGKSTISITTKKE